MLASEIFGSGVEISIVHSSLSQVDAAKTGARMIPAAINHDRLPQKFPVESRSESKCCCKSQLLSQTIQVVQVAADDGPHTMHQLRQHALVGRQLHGTSSSSAPKRQTGQWSTRFCCRVTPKSRFQRLEICGKRKGHGRYLKCRGASENPKGIQSQWHADGSDGSILHFTSILSVAMAFVNASHLCSQLQHATPRL